MQSTDRPVIPALFMRIALLLLFRALTACNRYPGPITQPTTLIPPSHTATTTPQQPTETPSPTNAPATAIPSLTPTATPPSESVQVIGTSVAGRPLVVHSFGCGAHERMIVAGIHGGYEWNTIALADQLIAHLRVHPEIVPPDVTLHILRSLNPDGEARGRDIYARANDNNVDLNRNWPSGWLVEWPPEGCWNALLPLSGGTHAGSEPETQALMAFLESHAIEALVNYHSAALGIFPGGQPPDTASLNFAAALAQVSDYPYPPIDTGCLYSGQLIDWASDHGIAAIDLELTNHTDTDFARNLTILEVLLTWSLPP